MDPILFRYRTRDLIADDIAQIRETIAAQYARGSSHIAHTLCEQWQWRQANGGYKEFAPRDRYIGRTAASKRTRLHLLTNNVRFLIVPWVRVAHLASKVLALSGRGLAGHWQQRYGHGLVLAETLVDCARFAGTCYRAANWTCMGETQGHAKRGNAYHRHGVVKGIYLSPFDRHWRAALTAELAAR